MEVMNVIEPSEKCYELRLTETEMNMVMIGLGSISQSTVDEAKRSGYTYVSSKLSDFKQVQTVPLWNSFRSLLGHITKDAK